MASQVLGSNSGVHEVNYIEKAVPNTHCACVGTIAPSPSVMRGGLRRISDFYADRDAVLNNPFNHTLKFEFLNYQ